MAEPVWLPPPALCLSAGATAAEEKEGLGVQPATFGLVCLCNIMVIPGLPVELQLVVEGSLILLAAAVYMRRSRR